MAAESHKFKNNILGSVSLILFLGTVVYLTIEMGKNARLEKSLKNEKLTSEAILSEKLLAEKSAAKNNAVLISSQKKEHELSEALALETEKRIRAENELKNPGRKQAISRLEDNIRTLSISKSLSEKELTELKTLLEELQRTHDELELTARLVRDENTELSTRLAALTAAGRISMNEILIESKKKNSSLTVRAKRTKQLVVHLETPATAGELRFKTIDPSGIELTDEDGTAKVYAGEAGKPALRNTDKGALSEFDNNKIQMIYTPKNKLKGGLYTIQVANDNRLISSLQVRLR